MLCLNIVFLYNNERRRLQLKIIAGANAD